LSVEPGLTGSHNLTNRANYQNDEILFRSVDDRAIHDAYYFHFAAAWPRGSDCTASTC
jgi:phosphatidylserine/phosphatidylglycerophosphate/cardiolipin synthase-like enzyme